MADMSAAFSITGDAAGLVSAAGQAEAALGRVEATGSRVGSVLGSVVHVGAVAAAAGLAALGAGLAASISTAANFEKQLSAISAVSNKTELEAAGGMQALSAAALQLGKDTSFSASEAAAGMEEMVKAGISIADVMGGGARAALDLAAAGAVSVAEAATVASNAMNAFGLAGSDIPHIADALAGASVASATDVHQLGFALASVGAVAHTIGLSFDDTTTAISLLAQAGLKGSDAGTSLKSMLLNLSPSTKQATQEMEQLGIITLDASREMEVLRNYGLDPTGMSADAMRDKLFDLVTGHKAGTAATKEQAKAWEDAQGELGLYSNQFFDAAGNVKSMSEIAGVLQKSMAGLTKEQQLNALQTIFGTDAIRAAAIMAEQGAEGFDKMTAAEAAAGGAQAIASERLNNFMGSVEKLKGSLETGAIMIGSLFLPALKGIADAATEGVNAAIEVIGQLPAAWEDVKAIFTGGVSAGAAESIMAGLGLSPGAIAAVNAAILTIGDAWRTVGRVFANDWSPSAAIHPLVNAVGMAATVVRDQLIPAIGAVAAFVTGTLAPAFITATGFLIDNKEAVAGVVAGYLAFQGMLAVVGTITAITTAWGALTTAVAASGGILGAVVAVLGGPVTLVIAGIAIAVGVLAAAWIGNWGDIQGKTAVVVDWLQTNIPPTVDTIMTLAATAADMAVAFEAWATDMIAAVTSWVTETATSITAWATDTATAITDGVTAIEATITGWATAITETFTATWTAITTGVTAAWSEIGADFTAGVALVQAVWQAGWDAVSAIVTAAWNLITPENQAKIQELLALFGELWTVGQALWTAGTTAIVTLVTGWWATLATMYQTASAAITAQITTWWTEGQTLWTAATTAVTDTVTAWWTALGTAWTTGTAAITAIVGPWWTSIEDAWNTAHATIGGATEGWWATIGGAWATGTAAISTTLGAAWAGIVEATSGLFARMGEAFTGAVTTLGESAAALGKGIVDALIGGINASIGGIADALIAGVKGAIGAATGAIPGFGGGGGGGGGSSPGQLMSYHPTTGGDALPSADEIDAYIFQQAKRRGWSDRDASNAVAVSRGERAGQGAGAVGDSGSSFGVYQLHVGGLAPGPNAGGGLGNTFMAQTGLDPRDPSTWRQQVDFSLGQVERGGWGPWTVGRNLGLTTIQPPGPPVVPPNEMQRIPLGPNPLTGGTTGIGGWTPTDMQAVIDLAPPWERAMDQVQTAGETAFTGVLKSSTDMGNGVTLTTTQTGNVATATMTDAGGNILGQWTSDMQGVSTATEAAGTAVITTSADTGSQLVSQTTGDLGQVTSTYTTATGVMTQVVTNASGVIGVTAAGLGANLIATSTDSLGQVTSLYQTSAGTIATVVTDQSGQVISAYSATATQVDAISADQATAVTTNAETAATGAATAAESAKSDVLTSYTDLGNGVTMVTTTTAAGTVSTLTDWQGQVIGVYSETESQASGSVDTLASNTEDGFSQAGDAVGSILDPLGKAAGGYKDTGSAAKGATGPVKEFGSATQIKPPNLSGFIGDLDDIRAAAKKASQEVGNLLDAKGAFSGIGKASGGPVFRDTTYLVGEEGAEGFASAGGMTLIGRHGPELFSPPVSGVVIPHHRLRGLATGGYVQVDGQRLGASDSSIDYDKLAEAIVKAGAKISDRHFNLTVNTSASYEPIVDDFAIIEAQSLSGL